jgi:hypothetical protein
MKRLLLCFLSFASLMQLQTAEQKDVLEYKKLPEKLFFKSGDDVFYIRPANVLSSSAFTNLLSSSIILEGLKDNKGSSEAPINIQVSRNELFAFINFVKNLDKGDFVQAYKAAFSDTNKGFQILNNLKINEKIINVLKELLASQEREAEAESLKRKRDPEAEEVMSSYKKTQTAPSELPLVHIKKQDSDKFFTVSQERIAQLLQISDSLIANTISYTPQESIVEIEFPQAFEPISLRVIEVLLDIAIDFYKKKTKDQKMLIAILSKHIPALNLASLDTLKLILHQWIDVADFLGYQELHQELDNLSEELKPLLESPLPSELQFLYQMSAQLPSYAVLNQLLKKNILTIIDAKDVPQLIKKVEKLVTLTTLFNYTSIESVLIDFLFILEKLQTLIELHRQEDFDSLKSIIADFGKSIPPLELQKTVLSGPRQVVLFLKLFFKENPTVSTILDVIERDPLFK